MSPKISKGGKEARLKEEGRGGPETMLAHTQTRRAEDKHTDRQTQAITQRWVFGPPEFSCLLVTGLPYWMVSTVHQTWGRERNFPSHRIGCLPAHPLASALRQLERLICSRLYRKLSPAPDTFLLHSWASDLHWTFLSCLSTGAIICPSTLSWKCSLPPDKGSRTSPQMFCPMSKSLSGKREGFQDNAIHKKGSLLLTRIRAPAARPTQWCRVREPWAEGVAQIYKVCISG